MEEKIKRICQSFPGPFFDVNINRLKLDLVSSEEEKKSARDIISHSKMTFRDYLIQANKKGEADVSVFKVYKLFVMRQKSISYHLNMFK
jgi:hypothetical protein